METIMVYITMVTLGIAIANFINSYLINKKEKALNDYQKALEKTRVLLDERDIILTIKMNAVSERQDLINELIKKAMTTKLTKEAFDFIKTIGMVITTAEDKTYIHLPHVFEVVSESYNIVIEHYNDKKLPQKVKDALIENAICKPIK